MAGPAHFKPIDIPTGLQGYWELNASGNRPDSSGNGNTLTDNNTVGASTGDYWYFGGNTSVFVSSNNEWLSITDASQTGLEMNGTYTVAGWIRPQSMVGDDTFISKGNGTTGLLIYVNTAGEISVYHNASQVQSTYTPGLSNNRWYHIAITFDDPNNLLYYYVNGNLWEVLAQSTTPTDNAQDFTISYPGSNQFDGYMKDVAIWNTILTPVQIKSLAMGVDLSSVSYRPNNVSVAPSAWWKMNEYSAGVGAVTRSDSIGSVHLTDVGTTASSDGFTEAVGPDMDGTTNYFTSADNTVFDFSGGVFSISAWVKSEVGTLDGILAHATDGSNFMYFLLDGSGKLNFRVWQGGSQVVDVIGKTTFAANTWYHVAVTEDGDAWRLYVDGADDTASGGDDANRCANYTGTVYIGANETGGGNRWPGRIVDLAIWKGYALSTDEVKNLASAFAIQQLGLVSYWQLDDQRKPKTVTAVGDAQIDTDQFKFGSSSALFDGTGDYIAISAHPDLNYIGTGDFTVDFWVRFATGSTSNTRNLFRCNDDEIAVIYNINTLRFEIMNVLVMEPAWTPTVNTWYHIAATRVGASARLYVDGVQLGTDVSNTAVMTGVNDWRIGANVGGTDVFSGHMDEIRFSTTARWHNDFSVPTSAYSTDDYTALLLHCEGADASTTFTDSAASSGTNPATYTDYMGRNTLTTVNSPVQVIGKVGSGADMELGSTQYAYITDAAQSQLDLGYQITMLAWMRPESAVTMRIVDKGVTNQSYGLRMNSTLAVNASVGSVEAESGGGVATVGVWGHYCGVYTGASIDIVFNSVSRDLTASTSNATNTANNFELGRNPVGLNQELDGSVDDVAIFARHLRPEEIKIVYINGLTGQPITYEPNPALTYNTGQFFAVL